MKRYTQKPIILVSFLFSVVLSAQYGAQKRGDYYFGQFAYAKAIAPYQKMINGNFKTKYAHRQLAECYMFIRDYKKAIPHFEAIINDAETSSDYFFKYAMALISASRKEEAEVWLKKYGENHKGDPRLTEFLKNGNLASVIFNSRERYEVSPSHLNSKASDFGIFEREGTLYFASARASGKNGKAYGWNKEPWLDIFVVDANDDTSKMPRRISGDINTKYHESSPIFTTDYKKDTVIYFTRNNFYKNKVSRGAKKELNLKIFRAGLYDGEWKVNKSLPINSDYYSNGHPFVSPDGKRLYYSSDRPGGFGGSDIWYSEIGQRGKIGVPINAGPIVNTADDEMFPFVNEEGKLFFSSDGHVGFGQLDVFSTLMDTEGAFVDIINLGTPLNSSRDDFAFYMLKDGFNGYVSSNREGGLGSDDIYKIKFKPSLSVEGVVTDGVNHKTLDSVAITLFDQETGLKVAETTTDKQGYYRMFIERGSHYMIEAVRRTHPHKNVFFNTHDTSDETKSITQNIVLEPALDLKLLANLRKIYFDFNKSDIRPDAALELDKVIELMLVTYPEMTIQLEAHTDPIGSHSYNDKLSEARAASTYAYLIANGVPKRRILSHRGFGKRKPINDCTGREDCSNEELELNRRTEFPIVQISNQRPNPVLAKNK
ncbi:MAG: OmpA family protein [Bacteroidota bacterium]